MSHWLGTRARSVWTSLVATETIMAVRPTPLSVGSALLFFVLVRLVCEQVQKKRAKIGQEKRFAV